MSESSVSTMRLTLRALGLALLPILAAACGLLDSKEEVAEQARVVVTGTAPVPLELVTSTKFTRTIEETGETTISLAFADTVFLSLPTPHDKVYPVRPDRGFLVRLRNPSTDPAVVSMQVFFDGKLSFERQNVTVQDGSLEFSYIFEGKVPN